MSVELLLIVISTAQRIFRCYWRRWFRKRDELKHFASQEIDWYVKHTLHYAQPGKYGVNYNENVHVKYSLWIGIFAYCCGTQSSLQLSIWLKLILFLLRRVTLWCRLNLHYVLWDSSLFDVLRSSIIRIQHKWPGYKTMMMRVLAIILVNFSTRYIVSFNVGFHPIDKDFPIKVNIKRREWLNSSIGVWNIRIC